MLLTSVLIYCSTAKPRTNSRQSRYSKQLLHLHMRVSFVQPSDIGAFCRLTGLYVINEAFTVLNEPFIGVRQLRASRSEG